MNQQQAYEKMIKRVKSKNDESLMEIWNALEKSPCCPSSPWDYENGITMDDWMQAINSEIETRGIRCLSL